MQKSENKIKPMYYWSDGYREYGVLQPDHKKIKDDELVDVDDTENEFIFEPIVKKKKSIQDNFKRWFRKYQEQQRRWGRRFY